jgi:signal transduction histidine kinase
MPQEQKEVFAKFYRAENELTQGIDGTGLGLAIAQSIVEQYDGRIWVQSTWQKGSTFSFSVPRERQG